MVYEIIISDFNLGMGIGFILGVVFILLIGFYFKPKGEEIEIGGLNV